MTELKELTEVAECLQVFSDIAKDFYDCLIAGQMSEAGKKFPAIGRQLGSLNSILNKYRNTLQKNGLLFGLQSAKNSLFNTLAGLQHEFDLQAGLTDDEFKKDPETYKTLLEGSFKGPINSIVALANGQRAEVLRTLAALASIAKQKRYLDVQNTLKMSSYDAARETYKSSSDQIDDAEFKIVNSPVYEKKMHEKMVHGKWTGYMHARINDNLRLMYTYDPASKRLTYVDIITHDELDKS